jgi:uncharacterized small protein (DUF1192 family)
MKWDDIPVAVKMTSGAVAAVLMFFAYMTTYQTDVEAQAYQNENAQQLVLFRVQQIEAMIAQYRYQLLSAELTDEQREWIKDEIERLTNEINCIHARQC